MRKKKLVKRATHFKYATMRGVCLATRRVSSQICTAPILAKKGSNKGKSPAKGDLPSKICVTCGRPFSW